MPLLYRAVCKAARSLLYCLHMEKICLAKKEVFWDFDGTLFDSYPLTVQAAQKILHAHQIDIPDEQLHDRMMTTVYSALRQIMQENHASFPLEEFNNAFHQIDPACFPLYPHVKEVLQLTVDQGGHNYLLTHRDHSAIEALEKKQIVSLFTDYITSESGYPRKPDPSGLLAMMQKYDLSAEDVIVIGDRELEIELARKAGVCVLWYASTPVIPKMKPDAVIHDYSELLPSR